MVGSGIGGGQRKERGKKEMGAEKKKKGRGEKTNRSYLGCCLVISDANNYVVGLLHVANRAGSLLLAHHAKKRV